MPPGVVVASTSSKGRTFSQASDSVFSRLDGMVEPEPSAYKIHPSAKEIWGRNLDGVDPDATKAAMDEDVVATKEEAESLLQVGTRIPKSLTEIKEVRRRMAIELKVDHPEVYTEASKTHLPATEMPDGEFTSAAAAKKLGVTNPYGAGAKTLDPFLQTLSEGFKIRRQILEVNSSQTYYAFDEMLAAVNGYAPKDELVEIMLRLREGMQMTEVVAQELLMLPSAQLSTKFIDLAKQKEAQNRGNPVSNAAISLATAAGITVNVSSGSQKYLGSGSSNTSKDDPKKPPKNTAPFSPTGKKQAAERRLDKKKRQRQAQERERADKARKEDATPAATGVTTTPGKYSGKVPGTDSSPNGSPGKGGNKKNPTPKGSGAKQTPPKGKGNGRK